MALVKGRVTRRKTWYSVMTGKKTTASKPRTRGAFGAKSDALHAAREWRAEHPGRVVGVYQVSKVKLFASPVKYTGGWRSWEQSSTIRLCQKLLHSNSWRSLEKSWLVRLYSGVINTCNDCESGGNSYHKDGGNT